MSYYEILLFAHIAGVAVWAGGGLLLILLGSRLGTVGDAATLRGLFEQAGWLANRVFTPVSLLVLVLGILLVIEGPWSFGQLWIVLGLAGFAATFVTGLFVLKPRADAINAMIARDGGMSDEAAAAIRRLFMLNRIDYAVLFMVIADMALKPTADDVGTLAAMAAVVVIVAVLSVRSARSPGARAARETA